MRDTQKISERRFHISRPQRFDYHVSVVIENTYVREIRARANGHQIIASAIAASDKPHAVATFSFNGTLP